MEPAFLPLRSTTSIEVAIYLGPLHCVADENDAATGAGNGSLDQQQALLGVDALDREVQDGDALATHATGHAHALEDTAGGRGGADGTRLAVVAVRTVRSGDTLEVVALHDTGEALTLRRAHDVDQLADLEGAVDGELLAGRELGGVGRADLGEVTSRGDARLVEVTGGRLVDLARVDLAVGDLDGVVAVRLGGADLGHDVRRDLDDGHGDELVVLIPDLGHAELLAEEALGGLARHGCAVGVRHSGIPP